MKGHVTVPPDCVPVAPVDMVMSWVVGPEEVFPSENVVVEDEIVVDMIFLFSNG